MNIYTTPELSQPTDPSAVCVVGSGPVGLAFALRLAKAGRPVTLIDSGSFASQDQGREFNLGTVVSAAKAQDCSDSTLVEEGRLYQYLNRDYLAWSRYLGSGGSSWRWGIQWRPSSQARVRIVPGARTDFEARPELDIPGWAVPADDVYSLYKEALAFFDLADHNFSIDNYQDAWSPLPLSTSLFPTKLFHFARADVIHRQRMSDVIAHPGIDVRSDLHLVRIEADNQKRVTALITCSPDGIEHRIEAEHYVLALGGIENSRQLLLAKYDGALADPHDVFGRWFCDHPHVRLGYLAGDDHNLMAKSAAWYDFQEIQGTPILRGHELSPDASRELDLLRFSVDLVGRPAAYCTKSSVSFAQAVDAAKQRNIKKLIAPLVGLAASPAQSFGLAYLNWKTSIHGTHLGGWSDPTSRQHSADVMAVEAMFEQRPSPDNRVRLGPKRDRFGRQLPVLQWSWSSKEVNSINRATDLIAKTFKDLGIGPFISMRALGQGPVPRAGSGFHHMGGTRQGQDPADSVVNAENRVHGVENLTLIGSSIFPNSVGYANPTLTAVADALRVANLFV